jgi:16S rRNA C967 or C1407 C5-methylase (RsmB/RsmF family)/NOL1/NOP2/fmu family ribosome biogenesis protein
MQLPEAFISRTKALAGKEWEAFEQALNQARPTSIRFNPFKNLLWRHYENFSQEQSVVSKDSGSLCRFEVCNDGNKSLLDVESPVCWASNAYYLSSRPVFTLDPLFHAGCYYVQEASSMFLEHFVKNYIRKPVIVLDLCAAPGGKSTHLSAVLPEGSLLVANETIRRRTDILSENLIKWGNPQTIVTCNYPADIGKLKSFFDLIVCDLPCSGEGMFRKDPGSIAEWSVRNVNLCAERQRQIISDIFPALKPGGILIYSTCTYNREENEDNIDRICKEFNAELLEEPRRFMPHKTKGEGFFIAAVRKDGQPVEGERYAAEKEKRKIPGEKENDSSFFASCLTPSAGFSFFSENNILSAFPSDHYKEYLFLKKSLKIVSAGIVLGEVKGKNHIPNHSLAMSTALSEKSFPRWDLDLETALKYLRKEVLRNIPAELLLGFVLVSYRNQPLGFVKNIGNRANNLYPQEWRIRNL